MQRSMRTGNGRSTFAIRNTGRVLIRDRTHGLRGRYPYSHGNPGGLLGDVFNGLIVNLSIKGLKPQTHSSKI